MERERISLGAGIAIYRERRSWLLDLNIGGTRIRRSLRTVCKWDALQLVASMRPDEKPNIPPSDRFKAENLSLPSNKAIPVVNNANPRIVCVVQAGITIEDACSKYLDYLKTKGDDIDHIKNVGGQIRMFARFAKVERVQQIEPRHIVEYLNSFAEKAARTRRQKLWTLRTWLKWCVTMQFATRDATAGIASPRIKRGKVNYLSFEEVALLFQACAGTEFDAIIRAAVYCGMRLDEMLALEPTDVDLNARWLNLDKTKTDWPRDVPMLDQAVPAFESFVKAGTFGFEECGNTRDKLKAVFNAAGIAGTDKFKLLRRTFVTHALLNEIDPYVVARWSGHDVHTQQKYYAGIRRSHRPLDFTWCGKRIPRSGRLEPNGNEGDQQGAP